ncbi:UDP-N-acetyl-D-mannosamine dehydrogenase [bacterium]|nr:UDP-N-acetyl-D-mannosamine dehydrogenase [bacterium]
MKKICIMGMGYIGLPTAALLANRGYLTHGVDVNQYTIDTINLGKIHIVEPELEDFVYAAVRSNTLTVNMEPVEADIFMIAVPTPFYSNRLNKITNSPMPNVDYVISATKKIAPYIRPGNLVLLESTSPVGTTDMIADILKEEGVDINSISIAHSPERVLPGCIMRELIENDRVVGGINKPSTRAAAEFYRTFVKGEVLETTAKTAEMTKLTENSFRDVNIAFANELSMLCDDIDIDIGELISLANRHPRVSILSPGCGVGGHCISVDPWFIVDSANGKAKIIEQARRTNDYKADWVVEKIKNKALQFEKDNGRIPTIACMGLAFKPDIDDLRESPALYIVRKLCKDISIKAVEPNIEYCKDIDLVSLEAGLDMDICVYLVAHSQFKGLDIKEGDLVFCGGIE